MGSRERVSATPAACVAALTMSCHALLDRLDASTRPEDMNLPGWGWHPLKGDRKGTYAVSVSGNWRLTYKFAGVNATDVDLEDYH